MWIKKIFASLWPPFWLESLWISVTLLPQVTLYSQTLKRMSTPKLSTINRDKSRALILLHKCPHPIFKELIQMSAVLWCPSEDFFPHFSALHTQIDKEMGIDLLSHFTIFWYISMRISLKYRNLPSFPGNNSPRNILVFEKRSLAMLLSWGGYRTLQDWSRSPFLDRFRWIGKERFFGILSPSLHKRWWDRNEILWDTLLPDIFLPHRFVPPKKPSSSLLPRSILEDWATRKLLSSPGDLNRGDDPLRLILSSIPKDRSFSRQKKERALAKVERLNRGPGYPRALLFLTAERTHDCRKRNASTSWRRSSQFV